MQREPNIDRKKEDPPTHEGWLDKATETETIGATLFVF